MPELSAKQMGAVQSVLHRICPNLGIALSEHLTSAATCELVEVAAVPLTDLLDRGDFVLQTLFTFSNLEGSESALVISEETAHTLLDLMEGSVGREHSEPLSDAEIETLSAAMNGLVRGFASGLTGVTHGVYDIESSLTHLGTLTVPPVFALEGTALEAKFAVNVRDLPPLDLVALFTTTFVAEVSPGDDSGTSTPGAADTSNIMSEDDVAAMLSQVTRPGDDYGAAAPTMSGGAPLSGHARTADPGYPQGLEMILDIPLDVTVELGRVRMLIKDVLELSSGSIIELDRVAGEPVDLLVNGRLVAKGEVVVIDDNFGIRITEIVSPAERVIGLGKGR